MARLSKRSSQILEKIDFGKSYSVEEGIHLIKECASAKFDETIEVAIKLGVDPRKADQMVRGTAILPHGTGKKVRVLVFSKGAEDKEAKEAGADYVGFKELIDKIKGGWTEFDFAVASPDTMPDVSKLGRILGPRGLMPSPKTDTVTKEVGRVVRELKKGRIEFKVDRTGNLHIPVGKASFPPENLKENIISLMNEILSATPRSFKGTYIKKVTISSTMGPGIQIDLKDLMDKLGRR